MQVPTNKCVGVYSEKTFYDCPVEATIAAVGGKWKILIAQLRELEAGGIIRRTSYGEVPPRVDYVLTPHGQKLKPVLEAMYGWGQEHIRQYKREASNPVHIWTDPASML